MQRDITNLTCGCKVFMVVVCCTTYVAFYSHYQQCPALIGLLGNAKSQYPASHPPPSQPIVDLEQKLTPRLLIAYWNIVNVLKPTHCHPDRRRS